MKIETLAKFVDDIEKDATLQKEYWTKFGFDTNHITSWNESEDDGYVTIELITGLRQTIAIKYDDFIKLLPEEIKITSDAKAKYEYSEQ